MLYRVPNIEGLTPAQIDYLAAERREGLIQYFHNHTPKSPRYGGNGNPIIGRSSPKAMSIRNKPKSH